MARPPEHHIPWHVLAARLTPVLLSAGALLCVYGFHDPPMPRPLLAGAQVLLLAVYWAIIQLVAPPDWRNLRRWPWWDLLLIGGAAAGAVGFFATASHWGLLALESAAAAAVVRELWHLQTTLARSLARPGTLLPLSFALLIAVGTLLLLLPVATPDAMPISFIDALFTMTSAVCVTGLVVRPTPTGFTSAGQLIILAFIQLGGLGIILFGSTLAMLLGGRLSLRENQNLRAELADVPMYRITAFVRFVVIMTLLTEAIGAALLYAVWPDPPGGSLTAGSRLMVSVFHSVSAFCNAGFDLTGNSLIDDRYASLTHLVIAPLIVLGGLGAPALSNLGRLLLVRAIRLVKPGHYRPDAAQRAMDRMTLNTKVVLVTTAAAYGLGVVAILIASLLPYVYDASEAQASYRSQTAPLTVAAAGRRLADASFMSITARTAGFNSVPMEDLQPASRFTLMSLMFVGGSPGGTAGGVKTTVVALLVLSTIAAIRQRREVEAWNRTIADTLIRKAATLFYCYAAMIVLATLLLCLSEPFPLEQILFEVVSAATTTGLSLGMTAELTTFGKVVLIFTMFLGRVGPLALLGALLMGGGPARPYAYPHEDVVIG
jgi:trk system potassium uptake protein TrkH